MAIDGITLTEDAANPGLQEIKAPRGVSMLEVFKQLGADLNLNLGTVEGYSPYSRLRADMWFAPDGQTAFVAARYRMMMEAAGMSVPTEYYQMTIPALRRLLAQFGIFDLDHNLTRIGLSAPDLPAVGKDFLLPEDTDAYTYWRSLGGRSELWMAPSNARPMIFMVRAESPTVFMSHGGMCHHLDILDLREQLTTLGVTELRLLRDDNQAAPETWTVAVVLSDDQPTSTYESRPVGILAQLAASTD